MYNCEFCGKYDDTDNAAYWNGEMICEECWQEYCAARQQAIVDFDASYGQMMKNQRQNAIDMAREESWYDMDYNEHGFKVGDFS